jgi:hypothetical protein
VKQRRGGVLGEYTGPPWATPRVQKTTIFLLFSFFLKVQPPVSQQDEERHVFDEDILQANKKDACDSHD